MSDNTFEQTVAGAALLLSVIAVVAVLGWHHVLSGTEVYGALTTIITLGGGALAMHSGAKVGARAAGVTDASADATTATTTTATKTTKDPGK
jgi:hypothetical protein